MLSCQFTYLRLISSETIQSKLNYLLVFFSGGKNRAVTEDADRSAVGHAHERCRKPDRPQPQRPEAYRSRLPQTRGNHHVRPGDAAPGRQGLLPDDAAAVRHVGAEQASPHHAHHAAEAPLHDGEAREVHRVPVVPRQYRVSPQAATARAGARRGALGQVGLLPGAARRHGSVGAQRHHAEAEGLRRQLCAAVH